MTRCGFCHKPEVDTSSAQRGHPKSPTISHMCRCKERGLFANDSITPSSRKELFTQEDCRPLAFLAANNSPTSSRKNMCTQEDEDGKPLAFLAAHKRSMEKTATGQLPFHEKERPKQRPKHRPKQRPKEVSKESPKESSKERLKEHSVEFDSYGPRVRINTGKVRQYFEGTPPPLDGEDNRNTDTSAITKTTTTSSSKSCHNIGRPSSRLAKLSRQVNTHLLLPMFSFILVNIQMSSSFINLSTFFQTSSARKRHSGSGSPSSSLLARKLFRESKPNVDNDKTTATTTASATTTTATTTATTTETDRQDEVFKPPLLRFEDWLAGDVSPPPKKTDPSVGNLTQLVDKITKITKSLESNEDESGSKKAAPATSTPPRRHRMILHNCPEKNCEDGWCVEEGAMEMKVEPELRGRLKEEMKRSLKRKHKGTDRGKTVQTKDNGQRYRIRGNKKECIEEARKKSKINEETSEKSKSNDKTSEKSKSYERTIEQSKCNKETSEKSKSDEKTSEKTKSDVEASGKTKSNIETCDKAKSDEKTSEKAKTDVETSEKAKTDVEASGKAKTNETSKEAKQAEEISKKALSKCELIKNVDDVETNSKENNSIETIIENEKNTIEISKEAKRSTKTIEKQKKIIETSEKARNIPNQNHEVRDDEGVHVVSSETIEDYSGAETEDYSEETVNEETSPRKTRKGDKQTDQEEEDRALLVSPKRKEELKKAKPLTPVSPVNIAFNLIANNAKPGLLVRVRVPLCQKKSRESVPLWKLVFFRSQR